MFVIAVSGVVSWLAALTFHQIVYSLVKVGTVDDKPILFAVTILDILVVLPVAAILTGGVTGVLERLGRWWLAPVSVCPLLGYVLFQVPTLFIGVLILVYATLSAVTASMVIRLRYGLGYLDLP